MAISGRGQGLGMRLKSKPVVLTAIAAACIGLGVSGGASVATASGGAAADWPAFLHDSTHTSFNAAATSITPSAILAGNLQPVWRFLVPASPNAGSVNMWASPVVSNGVVYIGAEDGYFFAISEATRHILWSKFLGIITPITTATYKGCPGVQGIVSTAAVANDPVTSKPTVYVNAPDGHLYALDAATGAVNWKGIVGIPSTTVNDYYAWGSPLVNGGKVYVGISSECDNPLVPGGVVAFNQATGTQAGKFIDQPGTKLGGSVWASPAVAADGRIIVGTGNGYNGSGQPLYDDSMISLDPNTLSILDFWQIPTAQQIYDGDFGGSPTMFTATINGVSTPLVGNCNKNGFYYAFRQDDLAAGPVWSTQITIPYPGGSLECVATAIWDGTALIEGGGAQTTINGTTYPGSVQALDPATGTPIWQTGLPGAVVGNPTEDGSGVVAAVTLQSTGSNGVYL